MKIVLAVLCFVFSCAVGQYIPVFVARFFQYQWPFGVRSLFFTVSAVLFIVSIFRVQFLVRLSTAPLKFVSIGLWLGFSVGAAIIVIYGIPSRWAFLLQ